jgi:methylthioribose-1-phosphate isomerase
MIWKEDHLLLLDQRKIPRTKEYLDCKSLDDVIIAIKLMVVRGAPAIALSGIFGLVLFLKHSPIKPTYTELQTKVNELLQSRPTAVNLRFAIKEFNEVLSENFFNENSLETCIEKANTFAKKIFSEDLEINRKISTNGAALFSPQNNKLSFITHCNTGAIATSGIGTAIGVFRALRDIGIDLTIFVDETRPYLQGSRLTAWELKEEKISYKIITDSMAGWVMSSHNIDAVIVGADRIAANGDTANKIGTYSLAILAKEHRVPFYVAASTNSFDYTLSDGSGIVIEMRPEEELTQYSFLKNENGTNLIPEGIFSPIGARALNPSFDVTPAKYITGIITEKGVITPITSENIAKIML